MFPSVSDLHAPASQPGADERELQGVQGARPDLREGHEEPGTGRRDGHEGPLLRYHHTQGQGRQGSRLMDEEVGVLDFNVSSCGSHKF